MRTGLPEKSSVLYLGNLITEDGVIAYVMDILKNRTNAIVRNIPVIIDGKPTWDDKYVMTDEEREVSRKERPDNPKISLESKRIELTDPVFQAEMMNNPARVGDHIFDSNVIDNLKRLCYEPKDIDAGFKIWFLYNPTHRYAIGADTAEGIGRDSSTSAIIDFSSSPCKVIATFESAFMPPDLFGHELIRQGKKYGKCLLAPEYGNTGFATITVLAENYPESKIYKHTVKDKITFEETKKMGWHTTATTKSDAIYKLKTAVENGELEIYDLELLNELRHYQIRDLRTRRKVEGMTRHFDKLMACAIAWQMRDFTTPNRDDKQISKLRMVRQEIKNKFF